MSVSFVPVFLRTGKCRTSGLIYSNLMSKGACSFMKCHEIKPEVLNFCNCRNCKRVLESCHLFSNCTGDADLMRHWAVFWVIIPWPMIMEAILIHGILCCSHFNSFLSLRILFMIQVNQRDILFKK